MVLNNRPFFITLISFCCCFLAALHAKACQCPATQLSLFECNKYEIIFKGKILSVKNCEGKFGEAHFEVEELYKGNATKEFTVLFECGGECATGFNAGEEWIIYSRYKQINKALMDWCSRSRRYFRFEKEDFYTANYGNDYDEEVKFLRANFGLHRFLAEDKNQSDNRNKIPGISLTLIFLLSSIVVIIIFLMVIRRMKS